MNWSDEEKSENLVSIASLMLYDDGAEISAENISKVIKASGNTVEAYWPALFSKMLAGADVGSLLCSAGGGGSSGGAAAAGGDAGAAGGDAGAAAGGAKKEEKVEEE